MKDKKRVLILCTGKEILASFRRVRDQLRAYLAEFAREESAWIRR
jgi:hypothetical protein